MSLKPILFSAPMVQAILNDMKDMTRRVITNVDFQQWVNAGFTDEFIKAPENGLLEKAPIKAGDVLWVRETWRVGAWDRTQNAICVDYASDGHADPEWKKLTKIGYYDKLSRQSSEDAYAAGIRADTNGQYKWERGHGPTRWRPSIFMPKEVARIYLRITAVRAERLQDITEEDAIREGVMGWIDELIGGMTGKTRFQRLWDKLNAARGYGWDKNPWVWVYTFERITREEAMEDEA